MTSQKSAPRICAALRTSSYDNHRLRRSSTIANPRHVNTPWRPKRLSSDGRPTKSLSLMTTSACSVQALSNAHIVASET